MMSGSHLLIEVQMVVDCDYWESTWPIYTTDVDELLQIAEIRVTRRFAAKEK